MSKQVEWCRDVFNFFVEQAMLSEFEVKILESRINGMTVLEQSRMMMCSKSKVEKCIALMKKKYDNVQQKYPDKLPARKFSSREVFMDNN